MLSTKPSLTSKFSISNDWKGAGHFEWIDVEIPSEGPAGFIV